MKPIRARYYSCNTTDGWKEFDNIEAAKAWLSEQKDACEEWALSELRSPNGCYDDDGKSIEERLTEWLQSDPDSTWFSAQVERLDEDGDWERTDDNITDTSDIE